MSKLDRIIEQAMGPTVVSVATVDSPDVFVRTFVWSDGTVTEQSGGGADEVICVEYPKRESK